MEREDDQKLWDLLGEAPQPFVSPFFSRNVIRRVREVGGWRETVTGWFTSRRLIPATALALAIGFAAVSIQPAADKEADDLPEAVSVIDPQDYEVVADLDDLLAAEDDNVWDDPESLSL
ncbi:MAG: hypothetical protein H0U88_05165 [Chthoniobacterales bacterium]|nr:hypothetical protein [Chthoniobacterales bacterium]MDQ3120603.1 hypothetical protein [Verrucomicrobiota bacterium]